MISRYAIVTEARQWLGTRWHHQAALKGIGTDCIGLVAGVAQYCGVREADEFLESAEYRSYGRSPDATALLAACERWLDPIAVGSARPGDVLLLRFAREPQHFAIISDWEPAYIIHAYAQARKVVENRLDEVWAGRVMRAFSFRGTAAWLV